jgi:hypothetical protein
MDGRLSRGLFWGAVALLLPGLARADAVNAEWYSATRTLTMGNVGIASADDPEADAFFNPAALAKVKKASVEPLNPQVDFGGGFFTNAHSIADWKKEISFSSSQPFLRANPGTPTSVGFALFPNLTAQNFSFGVLVSGELSAYYDIHADAYHYHSRKLTVPTLGLSAAGLGGRFKLGAAVRAVQVSETTLVSPGSTTSTAQKVDFTRDGVGFALDTGATITMPWGGLPTFGFVARNIGGTAFPSAQFFPIGGRSNTRHELIKMAFDSGFALAPKLGRNDAFTFAVDFRDMLNSTHVETVRHANIGLEYAAAKMVFFRAGFSQGYWTAGFGLSGKAGSVDLGTYGDELTDSTYHGFKDRKYSMRISRRF